MKEIIGMTMLALALTACGGGGDSGPAATPITGTAEGTYSGTLMGAGSATNFQAVVLENGEYWVLYGTTSGGVNYIQGFAQGSGTSSNGTFISTNALDFGSNPPLAGNVQATYVPGVSFSGAIGYSAGTIQFNGTVAQSAGFDYNSPASLADIAGAWNLAASDGTSAPVTISPAGAVTGTNAGCSFTGQISPRPSGKNVFNVTVTEGSAPCTSPGATIAGIAVSYPIVGTSQRQLIVAGTLNRQAGAFSLGVR